MSDDPLKSRLELARAIAVEAGRVTLKYFRSRELAVQRKEDGSPLTIADQEAETLLRRRIGETFPDDAIVGEEYGEQSGTSGYCWVLDPIDGTKSFVTGVPLYGTMVGVMQGQEAVIGSIWFPGLDEGMYAATGFGAWYFSGQAEPVRSSIVGQREPGGGVLLTTCDQTLARRLGHEAWLRLGAEYGVCRTWGDVYGYMLVATGRAHVMLDPIMNVWDAAAVMPIILEAGGKFTDWHGFPRVDGGDSVATGGPWHDDVLAILASGNVQT